MKKKYLLKFIAIVAAIIGTTNALPEGESLPSCDILTSSLTIEN